MEKDNEIIKALECCLAQGITSECERCRDKIGCRDTLLRDALDLIKRQKAEIERLRKANESFSCMGKMYSEIKSEGRKEFAERVKKRAASRTYAQIWESDLDEVLAEMEERKGKNDIDRK